MDVNYKKFQEFLKGCFGVKEFKVFPLAGDASSRKYFRIVVDNDSFVLMEWEPFHIKDYPFLSVQDHFKNAGVHVPEVVHLSEVLGLVLLEDLGDLTLERKFWESQNQQGSLDFYKMAMDELILIHHKASDIKSDCTAFKVKFDTDKFMWEMNYGFDNLFLKLLNIQNSDSVTQEIKNIFLEICTRLDQEPKYISHRDYHSRNLMIKQGQMRVIDFQDARMGPVQYDLVSLLKDSYVDLNDEMSSVLMKYYLEKSKNDFGYSPVSNSTSLSHFEEIFELQSIQRCFKACGSFSSFYNQREDRRYLKYIAPTLRKVLKSLNQFPEYKSFSNLILDSAALEKAYADL
ncbi:MAG TPA: phosphotransferase [Pseudobdellovibrionaceae bacterium]|nr:phosphotransferase [Pseudobdellovibrionaceae bacterium]